MVWCHLSGGVRENTFLFTVAQNAIPLSLSDYFLEYLQLQIRASKFDHAHIRFYASDLFSEIAVKTYKTARIKVLSRSQKTIPDGLSVISIITGWRGLICHPGANRPITQARTR
jgi:hypothetical protein